MIYITLNDQRIEVHQTPIYQRRDLPAFVFNKPGCNAKPGVCKTCKLGRPIHCGSHISNYLQSPDFRNQYPEFFL